MSFWSNLFGSASDSTAAPAIDDWLPASGPPPQISLDRRALESFAARLKFGEGVEAARFLGRPTRSHFATGTARLDYDLWGLEIEFEEGRFVLASFTIGRSLRDGDPSPRVNAEPSGPDGRALTGRTTRAELLQRFGTPGKTQELGDETILYYSSPPLTSEFRLDEKGTLTGWDVYED